MFIRIIAKWIVNEWRSLSPLKTWKFYINLNIIWTTRGFKCWWIIFYNNHLSLSIINKINHNRSWRKPLHESMFNSSFSLFLFVHFTFFPIASICSVLFPLTTELLSWETFLISWDKLTCYLTLHVHTQISVNWLYVSHEFDTVKKPFLSWQVKLFCIFRSSKEWKYFQLYIFTSHQRNDNDKKFTFMKIITHSSHNKKTTTRQKKLRSLKSRFLDEKKIIT
jgi:hypothetical protein